MQEVVLIVERVVSIKRTLTNRGGGGVGDRGCALPTKGNWSRRGVNSLLVCGNWHAFHLLSSKKKLFKRSGSPHMMLWFEKKPSFDQEQQRRCTTIAIIVDITNKCSSYTSRKRDRWNKAVYRLVAQTPR